MSDEYQAPLTGTAAFKGIRFDHETATFFGKFRLGNDGNGQAVSVGVPLAELASSRIPTAPDNLQGMARYAMSAVINACFKKLNEKYPAVNIEDKTRELFYTAIETTETEIADKKAADLQAEQDRLDAEQKRLDDLVKVDAEKEVPKE